jgi:glycosyltransferase involved in cell wall biosynthesis
MKILLLGEYSNVHATLAKGLRQLGHEVTVASNGDFWKDYPRDIDLSRKPGKLGGLALMAKVYSLLPKWRGYDVVQFINPMFLELKAERLFPIFRYLQKHNKKSVLCAMGMDYYWVSECTYKRPLRYSDFNIGDKVRTDAPAVKEQGDWLGTAKEQLNKLIAKECDSIVAGLYEDYVCYEPYFPEKLHFIPLPIELPSENTPRVIQQTTDKTRVFIGISRGRSQYKGTDIMLRAAEDVLKRHPDRMELIKVEGVPFTQYEQMMNGSDAILDQLYSYTPSMNPLLAMSKGIICIGGGEPENYKIIHEDELRPIINVEPTYESVSHELEQLVLHPERVPELKRQSIEYVHRHHDHIAISQQYEQLYFDLLSK